MSLLLAFLLAAAPDQGSGLSAPHFPAGDAAIGPSAGQEAAPVLAHGSGVSLLVWSDRRSAPGATLGGPIFSAGFQQSEDDVLGQRLDAQGQLLDDVPFPIAAGAGRQVEPLVAFNGIDFLVAWRTESQVFARRVSATGALLDAAPILVDANADTFSLAANGATWLLVTESYSAGAGGLLGYRIAADGTSLDPAGVLVAPQQWYLYFGSRLSAAAGEWLLAYDDLSAGWVGQRLNASLAPIGAPFALPGRDLASAANSHLVAWEDAAHRLLVSRMQTDGTLLDPAGILVSSAWYWTRGGPRLCWDGVLWWVLFPDFSGGLSLARVNASGQNLDPGGFSLVPAALNPEQAALTGRSGGGAQLAWLEYRPDGLGAMHLQTQVAAGPGSLSSLVAASTGAPAQVRPDFAAHDDGVAAAYLSLHGETARVVVAWLDQFGNPLAPEPVEVFAGPSARTRSPAVAWNGSLFFVTWSDPFTGVWGRRLAADGTLLDPAPLYLMPGEECDVAALGTNFLVVGAYSGLIYSNRSIYAVRVDGASGARLDPAAFFVGGPFATDPTVAAVGGRWIVAWQNHWSSNSTIADLAVCFVAADGTSSGAVGVENQGYAPALASSGGEVLLAYRWGSIATPFADLKAQRIRADGTFLGSPIVVSAGAWKESEPAACWTGSEWWVAWEDQRHALNVGDGRSAAYAARLDANGILLDPAGIELAHGSDGVAQLALAGSAGQALAGWAELRRESPLANWRLGLRTGGAWQDLGFALAGAGGPPRLTAAGPLVQGGAVEFQVAQARAFASGRLFAGSARLDQPVGGGTMVPRRDYAFILTADAAGRSHFQVPIRAALPPGFSIYVQAWLLDPSAPQGFSASNAIVAVAP